MNAAKASLVWSSAGRCCCPALEKRTRLICTQIHQLRGKVRRTPPISNSPVKEWMKRTRKKEEWNEMNFIYSCLQSIVQVDSLLLHTVFPAHSSVPTLASFFHLLLVCGCSFDFCTDEVSNQFFFRCIIYCSFLSNVLFWPIMYFWLLTQNRPK